jgi:parvulin-like peptidyl-prolyl isomerase
VSKTILRSLILGVLALALPYGGYRLGASSEASSPLDSTGDDGPTVGHYGGRVLHLSELQARVDALPQSLRSRLDGASAREDLVKEMIKLELLARAAEDKGYHRDPEFVRRYAQELGQLLVRKEVDDRQKPPTDDEVRAWLDAHRSELTRPERVRLAVVSFLATDPSERTRKRALASAALAEARAKAGDYYSFGRIARERSEDTRSKGRNGELPPATREELAASLGPEAAEVAFAIQGPGSIAERVVETAGGFHVIKLLGREPAYQPRFEELREALRARISSQSRVAAVEKLTDEIWKAADVRIDEEALKQLQTKGKLTAALPPR